jgi:hypothetical protein
MAWALLAASSLLVGALIAFQIRAGSWPDVGFAPS